MAYRAHFFIRRRLYPLFIGTEKEIFECMEYLFLVCLFVITSLYSSVVYNGSIPCVRYKTLYFIAWNL